MSQGLGLYAQFQAAPWSVAIYFFSPVSRFTLRDFGAS